MRELPEPTAHMWQHGETGNTGFLQDGPQNELDHWEAMNRPRKIICTLFTRDQVLAIQKQAYEDARKDAGKDAERYRWLRSRNSLELRSDCGKWTRFDGSTFIASHYLAEGGTQHGAAPSLDETIDSAMLTASQKEPQ